METLVPQIVLTDSAATKFQVKFLFYFFFLLVALDYAAHFPDKGVRDFVKLSGMRNSLTQFTVCLWMSSSSSQGSPFSYAVSGQENELLIFYNGNVVLFIGGEKRLCRYLHYE